MDGLRESASCNSFPGRCYILELPAEIREQIWIHTVTTWTSTKPGTLEKQAIRVDYLNRPSPPAISKVNRQLYAETLRLYYQHNTFECWRPFISSPLWSQGSTLMFWLHSLGREKASWITSIILLYKKESELEYDIHTALALEGFVLAPGVLSFRQEQTEYEMCYEQLGLPRHFGKRRR